MKKSMLISILGMLIIGVLAIGSTTTFENKHNTYYGQRAVIEKLVVTVTPEAGDPNSVTSTAISDSNTPYFCNLTRVTIAAAGTDTDFTVTVKDENLLTIFEKDDCSTAALPATYMLYMDDTEGNPHGNIPVAGPITVDTNDVDPNNLTSVTVTLYLDNRRYPSAE